MNKELHEKRMPMAYQGWLYAKQRIDLLLISVCGAGVYVILELFKVSLHQPIQNLDMLKLDGLLFISAVILNFVAQFCSYKANAHDMIMSQCAIEDDESDSKKHDKLSERWTRIYNVAILLSIGAMLTGLGMLSYYFCVIL